jgi:serine O-acetyltransferase
MQVDAALMECASHGFIRQFKANGYLKVLEQVQQDFQAFLEKDPACYHNANLLVHCTSFKAVFHYRIAHQIVLNQLNLEVAFALSNRGKQLSGAEIHPCATLGKNFILDHGVGTVIGDTAVVGDDCYVLGGVILGANGISNNSGQKRHPTIGHSVQLGTRAKVLGNIHIGDHVFVGADCLITSNIESHHRVVLQSTHQVSKISHDRNIVSIAKLNS